MVTQSCRQQPLTNPPTVTYPSTQLPIHSPSGNPPTAACPSCDLGCDEHHTCSLHPCHRSHKPFRPKGQMRSLPCSRTSTMTRARLASSRWPVRRRWPGSPQRASTRPHVERSSTIGHHRRRMQETVLLSLFMTVVMQGFPLVCSLTLPSRPLSCWQPTRT